MTTPDPTNPYAQPPQAPYGQATPPPAPYGQPPQAPPGQFGAPQTPYGQPPQAPYAQAAPPQAPYGQPGQPPAPYGQAPYGQPGQADQSAPAEGQPWGAGVPVAGANAGPKNVPLALLAGVGVTLACGLLYGFIAKATDREFVWLVLGMAAAIGTTLGKVGGKHPLLPPLGGLLTVVGLFFGEIFGIALIAHEHTSMSVTTLLFDHFSLLVDVWKEAFDLFSVLFIVLGAFLGVSMTVKSGKS
ncbi:hypothetical protein [Kitasatospora sp. NPDC048407]|uniref:hypothetical protein n=1 Tax=Kitasatospora sp. NPDC048407 TaxID=3364051 RepID=UPI003711EE27